MLERWRAAFSLNAHVAPCVGRLNVLVSGGAVMTELQQYLAEEVAEDHADGIITRREAVQAPRAARGRAPRRRRRCSPPRPRRRPAADTAHGSGHGHGHGHPEAATSAWAPVPRESITFAGPRGPLLAAWAPAAKPRGGVLVIHENRGLTEHIRNVAGRFAASGYSALALDLLSEEGGTGAFPGEAEVAAKLSEISAPTPAASTRT